MPTPKKLLCAALALACALPSPALYAQVNLPALGERASDDFQVADERRLGEQIMRDIWRDPAYLDDPVLLAYVQSLWQPLVASARRLGHIGADVDEAFAWQVFLVRDRSVNAFALPGGHVGVHLGLIAMTATRDELASVLAHELTHVSQRHIARSIGSSQRTSLVSMAAMMIALLASMRARNTDAAQAAIVGGQAATIQGQLNFSRDVEREADRIGFGVLKDADYAPGGMAAMFEKLEAANRLNDFSAFPYLRSHPLTTDRISEARARVLDAPPAPPSAANELLHQVMAARARVLMDPSVASLRRWQTVPPDGATPAMRLAAAVSAALASSLLREHDEARRAFEQARALAPAGDAMVQAALRTLGAEVLIAAGDAAAATALLDAAAPSRAVRLLRAQAVLAGTGDRTAAAREATESLQIWTAEHPDDAPAWRLLAQTADAAGLPLRSARAQAEARVATGDLSGAIDLLRATQRRTTRGAASEFIEAQVIDSRLRALVAQVRRERLERGLPEQER